MSGIRITVAKKFNNPLLPRSDVGSLLMQDNAIAIYEMRSFIDRGPNGHNLILNNISIDSEGLASDGVIGHNAFTGVTEPSAFTVLVAINVPSAPTAICQVYNTFAEPNGLPTGHTGSRVSLDTSGTLSIGLGVNNGGNGQVNLNCGSGIGGWAIFAASFSSTGLFCLRSNGTKYSTPLNGVRGAAIRPIILAGGYATLHNIGIPGHIGLFSIYAGALSESEMMTLIQKGTEVMRERGITV